MRKTIPLWMAAFFALLLSLHSCRPDILRNESHENAATQKSKFEVVRISEIPNVVKYIKAKTGRDDLKIPFGSKKSSSALAKAGVDFSNLESSIVIKKTEGDTVYYVFGLENTGDENTVYNYEVKEVNGDLVGAKIVEYTSNTPYGNNGVEVLHNFSGKVVSYETDGKLIASVEYIDGENPCPTYTPPSTGNPPNGTGEPGGISIPSPGTLPSNPGVPNYPSFPPFGGGSSGGGGPSSGGGGSSSGGGGSSSSGGSGCNPNYYTVSYYVHAGGGMNGPITAVVLISDCGKTLTISLSLEGKSKLASPCDDGSGVVVLPGGNPKNTPCEKIKNTVNKPAIKDSISNYNTYAQTSVKKEKGMQEYKDGGLSNGFVGDDFQVHFGIGSNSLGIIHVHPLKGIAMFSAKDILLFIKILREQDASTISNAYAGMISSSGNYFITFTGTASDLPPTMTDSEEKAYLEEIDKYINLQASVMLENSYYYSLNPLKLNQQGNQLYFFKLIEKMGLSGKVSLIKQSGVATSTITLNNDGNSTAENQCI